MRKLLVAVSLFGWVGIAGSAYAGPITFHVVSSLDGKPVDATATITTSTDQILVELVNNIDNPISIIQAISGVSFDVVGLTSASLSDSSGQLRVVAKDGTYTDLGISATDWLLGATSSLIYLNGLGSSGPDQTIIGLPLLGLYSAGNGSIGGNKPHNPFLVGPVSFTIAAAGVTDNTTVSLRSMSFGTTPTPVSVPEPSTLLLLSTGLAAVAARRRVKRR